MEWLRAFAIKIIEQSLKRKKTLSIQPRAVDISFDKIEYHKSPFPNPICAIQGSLPIIGGKFNQTVYYGSTSKQCGFLTGIAVLGNNVYLSTYDNIKMKGDYESHKRQISRIKAICSDDTFIYVATDQHLYTLNRCLEIIECKSQPTTIEDLFIACISGKILYFDKSNHTMTYDNILTYDYSATTSANTFSHWTYNDYLLYTNTDGYYKITNGITEETQSGKVDYKIVGGFLLNKTLHLLYV